MDQLLSEVDTQALRDRGLIGESEVAYRNDDLVIAENVVTKARRIIDTRDLVLETNRRLLKG